MEIDIDAAVALGRDALWLTVKLSLPLLVVGIVVGLIVGILQAATQVQDQTVAFVPKILATVAVIFLVLPWLLVELVEYTRDLVLRMASFW
ncbi:MAG: flagellar biosynthesis protein FliQ [Planctomycetes bacterium]|nr:flagellar biosynthesis protein FliQ [Planctomycetota bacterium]